MKYYKLKYTSSIKDGFGGKADMWNIRILERYRGDKGLLEHEKFHVRCWYYCLLACWLIAAAMYVIGTAGWWLPVAILGPSLHKMLYRNKYFRRLVETKAYRIQLAKGNYSSPQFAVNALMFKYELGLSEKKAKELLGLTKQSLGKY